MLLVGRAIERGFFSSFLFLKHNYIKVLILLEIALELLLCAANLFQYTDACFEPKGAASAKKVYFVTINK